MQKWRLTPYARISQHHWISLRMFSYITKPGGNMIHASSLHYTKGETVSSYLPYDALHARQGQPLVVGLYYPLQQVMPQHFKHHAHVCTSLWSRQEHCNNRDIFTIQVESLWSFTYREEQYLHWKASRSQGYKQDRITLRRWYSLLLVYLDPFH